MTTRILVVAACVAAFRPAPASGQSVPIRAGLVIVTAAHQDAGDYESIKTVGAVTPDSVVIHYNATTPGPDPTTAYLTRVVRRADLRNAQRFNAQWITDDPPVFPGSTVIGLSTAMLDALVTTGSTAMRMGLTQGELFADRAWYAGTITRVEPGPVAFPVLLNGRRVMLPTVHARGRLVAGGDAIDAEFWVLRDTTDPLVLRWTAGRQALQVVRIDEPPSGAAASRSLGDALQDAAGGCRTELSGIYFAFASAQLEPESDTELAAIAAVLRAHPVWAITLAGHTDSIGDARRNLELSQQRAAAVKDALVIRYHVSGTRITTTGFGSAQPVESNTTLEGRARNRRVAISRPCTRGHP